MTRPIITIFEDNYVDMFDARTELAHWDVDALFPFDQRQNASDMRAIEKSEGVAIVSAVVERLLYDRCSLRHYGEAAIIAAELLDKKRMPYVFIDEHPGNRVARLASSAQFEQARTVERFYDVAMRRVQGQVIGRMFAADDTENKPWQAAIAYSALLANRNSATYDAMRHVRKRLEGFTSFNQAECLASIYQSLSQTGPLHELVQRHNDLSTQKLDEEDTSLKILYDAINKHKKQP